MHVLETWRKRNTAHALITMHIGVSLCKNMDRVLSRGIM